MGRLNIFDTDNNFSGYILPSQSSGSSGGGGGDKGCLVQLFIILFIILLIKATIEYFWVPIVNWLETTSPYREILVYYSYVLIPFKYLYTGIVLFIKTFPLAWKFVVKIGLTQYPNLNLVLGIISMILLGTTTLFIISLLYKFFIRLYSIKLIKYSLQLILHLLLLPIYIIVFWNLFLLIKFIFISIGSWLFKK